MKREEADRWRKNERWCKLIGGEKMKFEDREN